MADERLWAPWRLEYIKGTDASSSQEEPAPEPLAWRDGAERSCFLCRAAANGAASTPTRDRELLVVARGCETIMVLNRYPYNNGHALVAPLRHVGEFEELTPAEHAECTQQLTRLVRAYRRRLSAAGFNIGLNLGEAAGAGVPSHLHWHVVPRWAGDNNFMPVLAGTRVIPQSLEALWELLTCELATEG
jgi:ATP adenylyltransferase